MGTVLRNAIETFAATFRPQGPVIEIGSYYPRGFEAVCDHRSLFPGREYIGCDIRKGLGVDRIENAESLTFGDRTAGTVLLFEILEHLRNPEKALEEAKRILCDDGILALSVPFSYRIHGYPNDYWRFTAAGIHHLLGDFAQKAVCSIGPAHKPATIFAVASKTWSPDFETTCERYERAIRKVFRRHWSGFLTSLDERTRDLVGLVLGRAGWGAVFFNPAEPGYYERRPEAPPAPGRAL